MVGKPLKTGVVVSPAGPLFYQVQTEGGQQWRIRIRMPVHSEQTIDYQKNTTREEKGIVERTLEENAAVFTARWKEGEAALQSADSTSVEHRRSST
ncbi:hypothetical protein T4D_16686 [Trichinella pseudospiralis]|uniref:Uncharacterized protein n=1 Tax=Trichinella pseudospiralis TaxID=6337 RepID=A0A0V1F487_TRIPS|nr:hypothetical protein T4D_16686 [Trichinella pseudospiralis]